MKKWSKTTNTTTKYLESKNTPIQKYSIWRNLHQLHLAAFVELRCPECKKKLTIGHLMTKCPKVNKPREWLVNEIQQKTNLTPILVTKKTDRKDNKTF